MGLTIQLEPDLEARIREQAANAGVPVERYAAQRMAESDLLWRIRTVAPETETRRLHHLMRRRRAGALDASESAELQALLDVREERAGQRIVDVTTLAGLREMTVKQVVEQLGLRPVRSPE